MENDNIVKLSMRIDKECHDQMVRLGMINNTSLAYELNKAIRKGLGRWEYPCIVKSGDSYMWFSPIGNYGDLTPAIYKRFIFGGLPPNIGIYADWTRVFETMYEAVDSFGIVIASQTDFGLVVHDCQAFIELNNKYEKEGE